MLPPRTPLHLIRAIATGVIVVDGRLRVLFTNESAAKTLASGDVLVKNGMGLEIPARNQWGDLGQMIRRTLSDARCGRISVRVERPATKSVVSLLIMAVNDDNSAPHAVVLIGDPDVPVSANREVLQQLYGFSDSQTGLAILLMQGKTLNEAAKATRLSIESARTYLKQMFKKTNTRRQCELLTRLLTSPAVLLPDRGDRNGGAGSL